MDLSFKYRKEDENLPQSQVYYHRIRYCVTHERFVVPWQMEESKREKPGQPYNRATRD